MNSSHPLLDDLLAGSWVYLLLSQSITATGLADLSMDDLMLRSGLGRLLKFGLGLLPNEQLLSCSLEAIIDIQDSSYANDGVAIAEHEFSRHLKRV